MLDPRIDYDLIERRFGCSNCRHESDGRWLDYCSGCIPGYTPSNYRPIHRSIYEKVFYNRLEDISYQEFLRFLNE